MVSVLGKSTMEEIEKSLRKLGVPTDESLLNYNGGPIEVTKGIVAYLKGRFGVKPSFLIYRRFLGISGPDVYDKERSDRDAFGSRVRKIWDKYETVLKGKGREAASNYLSEKFVFAFSLNRPGRDVKEAEVADVKGEEAASEEVGFKNFDEGNDEEGSALMIDENVKEMSEDVEMKEQVAEQSTDTEEEEIPVENDALPIQAANVSGANISALSSSLRKFSVKASKKAKNHLLQKKKKAKKVKVEKKKSEHKKQSRNASVNDADVTVSATESSLNGSALSVDLGESEEKNALHAVHLALRRERVAKERVRTLMDKLRLEREAHTATRRQLHKAKKELAKKERVQGDDVHLAKPSKERAEVEKWTTMVEFWKDKASKYEALIDDLKMKIHLLNSRELMVRKNGAYTKEFQACVARLKSFGVPDDKCGDVIVSVAVLMGVRMITDQKRGPLSETN